MAVKSGWSHTAAAFVALFLSRVLMGVVEMHIPAFRRLAMTVSRPISSRLAAETGLVMPAEWLVTLPTFVALTFAWGYLYHRARHG